MKRNIVQGSKSKRKNRTEKWLFSERKAEDEDFSAWNPYIFDVFFYLDSFLEGPKFEKFL